MADDTLRLAASNLALSKLGLDAIESLDDDDEASLACARVIDHCLRSTLRMFPWSFATKYATLTLIDSTLDESNPINGDWTYAYEYPSDCIMARRIVTAARRTFEGNPVQFRKGRENDALVLYTNEEDAVLEYTAIFDCPVEEADELFVQALAWRVAFELAPSLAKNGMKAQSAWAFFLAMIDTASAKDHREAQEAPQGEAEWMRAR